MNQYIFYIPIIHEDMLTKSSPSNIERQLAQILWRKMLF